VSEFAAIYKIETPSWEKNVAKLTRTRSPFVPHAIKELLDRKAGSIDASIEAETLFPEVHFRRPTMLTSRQRNLIQTQLKRWEPPPVDGQRTVEMLELAAYADVTCHSIEWPLRLSTLDFVRSRLDRSEITRSIEWIRDSYKCRLANKILADSMELRMREYAHVLTRKPLAQATDEPSVAPKPRAAR